MKNKMADVRNHLVAMMEVMGDPDVSPESIAKARATAELAKAYTDTVRCEIDARRMAGVEELPEAIEPRPALEVHRK